MGAVLDFRQPVQLESTTCWSCGVEFAMPAHMLKKRREDSRGFFCPNGHEGFFVESEVDRLRKQLEAEQRTRKWTEEWLKSARKERDHQEQRARALRGVVTRTKKRISNGVCPCCNRTFTGSRLAAHIKTKHPEYANGEAEP